MLDKIILRPAALKWHRAAPLLRERESFLTHLASEGQSREKVRDASAYLVHFVRRTNFTRMRRIRLSELRTAADLWLKRNSAFLPGLQAKKHFLRHAKAWLKFHGKLVEPHKWNKPGSKRVHAFSCYLRTELGFASRTIQGRIWSLNHFFQWLENNQVALLSISSRDVERYLDFASQQGWGSASVGAAAHNLKVFFRFAERRRWCRKGIAVGIFGPQRQHRSRKRQGPDWADVCQLIDSANKDNPDDLRARAVLLLLAIYALRASEVANLNMADVDFNEGILTIRRSKNRLIQRFPLEQRVRTALQDFMQKGRPQSESPRLFLTLRRPHGPIQQASLYNITKTRMRRLNIVSLTSGPHSLRHACAIHLLTSGAAVSQVASLLGHSSSRYIGAYVKHSVAQLRPVADFSLKDLLAPA